MIKEYKFSIEVKDNDADEIIYDDWAFSLESLEEKFYKIDRAIKSYETKLEKQELELEENDD